MAQTTPDEGPRLRRKSVILDQRKIDRAKQVLGAATETEAISRALDAVAEMAHLQADIDAELDLLVGKCGFVDVFGAELDWGPPVGREVW